MVLCGHDDVGRALFWVLLRSAVHKKSIKRVYFAAVCQHHFADKSLNQAKGLTFQLGPSTNEIPNYMAKIHKVLNLFAS